MEFHSHDSKLTYAKIVEYCNIFDAVIIAVADKKSLNRYKGHRLIKATVTLDSVKRHYYSIKALLS